MAYLHHSHVAPVYAGSKPDFSKLGKGEVGILEVLKQLRDDKDLTEFKNRRGAEIRFETTNNNSKQKQLSQYVIVQFRKELNCPRKGFQTNAMALLEKGDHFAKLILSINMPNFKSPSDAASWALDQAITAFQVSNIPQT